MTKSKLYLLCVKEFKDYLFSFRTYLIITLYLIVSGYLISSYIGAHSNTNIEGIMPSFVSLFIFFIPLLVSNSFYKEHKSNSIVLLMTSPTSSFELLLSKFISTYLICISTLFLNFVQFAVIRFIDIISFRILISSFFGFALLIAMLICISILICTLIKNSYASFLSLYILFLLLFLSTYFETYIPTFLKGIYSMFCIFYDLNAFWYMGKVGFFPIIHTIATCFISLYISIRICRKRWLL